MKFPVLLISDLHLTSKPSDEYRWGIFPWLRSTLCKKSGIQSLVILGDLTDSKDFHGSLLVNRIVNELLSLTPLVQQIYILKGNHDYLKPTDPPFFSFLGHHEKITYIDTPYVDNNVFESDALCLFLPHTRTPKTDWAQYSFLQYDFVFMHQTVRGAKASNGVRMDGELDNVFDDVPSIRIYSGDIHVPQDIGDVRYVGSPYPVHFGDRFRSRALVIDGRFQEHEIGFKTLKRLSIKGTLDEIMSELADLKAGDQVKVELQESIASGVVWQHAREEIIDACTQSGIELFGLKVWNPEALRVNVQTSKDMQAAQSHSDVVSHYVEREDLGADALEAGLSYIKD